MRSIFNTTTLATPLFQALVAGLAFPGVAHGAESWIALIPSPLLRTAALVVIAGIALRLGVRMFRRRAPELPARGQGYGLERRTPVGGRPPRRAPTHADPDWSAIVKRRPLPDNLCSRHDRQR